MLARLDRAYAWLIDALGMLAGCLFGAMALGIGADVLARTLTGRGIFWMIEVLEYGLLVATLCAVPWGLREGAHVTVELVQNAVGGRLRTAMRLVAALLGALISSVTLYYGWAATAVAAERGSLIFKSLVFPEWWLLAVVPAGMALLTVEFLRLAMLLLGGRPTRRPTEETAP